MKNLLRLIQIWFTFGRYRLDLLLPKNWQNKTAKFLLLPYKCFPQKKSLSEGERLRYALEELGPIFVKFGQLLSTRPDIIPPHLMEELSQLQDNVKPFDSQIFKQLVEKSLNQTIAANFRQFEERPLASASIAQVHAAQLHDGRNVVVKAVRPGIESIIYKDTSLMLSIAELIERFVPESRRFRPVEVVEEYQETIFDELDLLREAANATHLRRNFEQSRMLYVPEIYWDFCRANVLVMERIYGAQVNDLKTLNAHNVDIKRLAEKGVEIFFTQVFEHNFFHADMHPGNVFVALDNPNDPMYIALDMAIIGTLSRQDQFYLARNMLAMFRRDYRLVAELHVLSGWVPKDTSIGAFEAAIRTVCEPIFEKPIKDIAFGDALIKLFQTARRFNMPVQPQLVLLQKTLVNIEGLGRQLYPDLDLWSTAHPFLERWVKQRFHPKNLYKDLRRQGPEWMEKIPELPHLFLETTENINQLAQIAPQLAQASEAIADEKRLQKRRTRRKLMGGIAFLAAIYLAWPQLQTVPLDALVLLLIGLLAILVA